MNIGGAVKNYLIFKGIRISEKNNPLKESPAVGIKNPLTGTKVRFDGKEEEKNNEIKKKISSGKRSELYRKRKLTATVLLIF